MNKIIIDFEGEYQRLEQGLNITRNSKRKHIVNAQFRKECKDKLMNGIYSNQQYLHSISITIGKIGKHNSAQYTTINNTETEHEESSDDEHDANEAISGICLICCQTKQGLFAFVPCGHANLCKNCGQHL